MIVALRLNNMIRGNNFSSSVVLKFDFSLSSLCTICYANNYRCFYSHYHNKLRKNCGALQNNNTLNDNRKLQLKKKLHISSLNFNISLNNLLDERYQKLLKTINPKIEYYRKFKNNIFEFALEPWLHFHSKLSYLVFTITPMCV